MYLQVFAKAHGGGFEKEPKSPLQRTAETPSPKDEQCVKKIWEGAGRYFGKADTHLRSRHLIDGTNRRIEEAQNENVRSDFKS